MSGFDGTEGSEKAWEGLGVVSMLGEWVEAQDKALRSLVNELQLSGRLSCVSAATVKKPLDAFKMKVMRYQALVDAKERAGRKAG